MNTRQNQPGPGPNGQVQLPTIPPHALKRFKVHFAFAGEGSPGGEAMVQAKDLAGAVTVVLAQLHAVAIPLKALSIQLVDPPIILTPQFASS